MILLKYYMFLHIPFFPLIRVMFVPVIQQIVRRTVNRVYNWTLSVVLGRT